MQSPLVRALVLALCLAAVNAHSWMHCADYTEENGRVYDAAKCRGYPRNYAPKFGNAPFGTDVGMNYMPSDAVACQAPLDASSYTAQYPAATYHPGQKVCMAWPAKNHVAATCTNPYIPDSGTKIKRSQVNPTADPRLSEFITIHDFGANPSGQIAGKGFQNCPDFCSNMDKSLCTGCFTVPADLAEGKYTFMWEWAFNSPNDKYTTCYDVTVSRSSNNADPAVLTPSEPGGTPPEDDGQGGGGGKAKDDGETSYSAGSMAAGVIVTLIAVTAIFVGIMVVARKFPHSKVGTTVHRVLSA